mgnify:CR=1 FL=1
MKYITDLKDFAEIERYCDKVIHRGKQLPDNVFTDDYTYFTYTPFDNYDVPGLFEHVQQYMRITGQEKFWFASLDPIHLANFKNGDYPFAAVELTLSDTFDDFEDAINSVQTDDDPGGLDYYCNFFIFLSDNLQMGLFLDRSSDLGVCGFKNQDELMRFKRIEEEFLFHNATAAAKRTYLPSKMSEYYIKTFIKHYGINDD